MLFPSANPVCWDSASMASEIILPPPLPLIEPMTIESQPFGSSRFSSCYSTSGAVHNSRRKGRIHSFSPNNSSHHLHHQIPSLPIPTLTSDPILTKSTEDEGIDPVISSVREHIHHHFHHHYHHHHNRNYHNHRNHHNPNVMGHNRRLTPSRFTVIWYHYWFNSYNKDFLWIINSQSNNSIVDHNKKQQQQQPQLTVDNHHRFNRSQINNNWLHLFNQQIKPKKKKKQRIFVEITATSLTLLRLLDVVQYCTVSFNGFSIDLGLSVVHISFQRTTVLFCFSHIVVHCMWHCNNTGMSVSVTAMYVCVCSCADL